MRPITIFKVSLVFVSFPVLLAVFGLGFLKQVVLFAVNLIGLKIIINNSWPKFFLWTYFISLLGLTGLIINSFLYQPVITIMFNALLALGFIGIVPLVSLFDQGTFLRAGRTIFWIGVFSSFGLLVDFSTNLFVELPRAEFVENGLREFVSIRRSSFLFGASTLVFPFISFAYVLGTNLLRLNLVKRFLLFILFSLAILSTLSKSAILGWFLLHSILMLKIITKKKILPRIVLITGAIGLIILGVGILEPLQINEDLASRLSFSTNAGDGGNSHRIMRWTQALEYMGEGRHIVFGNGLGTTNGQYNTSDYIHTHYESSFFRAYYEGGIAYVFAIYGTLILGLVSFRRSTIFSSLRFNVKSWLFVYTLVISVAPISNSFHHMFISSFAVAIILFLK